MSDFSAILGSRGGFVALQITVVIRVTSLASCAHVGAFRRQRCSASEQQVPHG